MLLGSLVQQRQKELTMAELIFAKQYWLRIKMHKHLKLHIRQHLNISLSKLSWRGSRFRSCHQATEGQFLCSLRFHAPIYAMANHFVSRDYAAHQPTQFGLSCWQWQPRWHCTICSTNPAAGSHQTQQPICTVIATAVKIWSVFPAKQYTIAQSHGAAVPRLGSSPPAPDNAGFSVHDQAMPAASNIASKSFIVENVMGLDSAAWTIRPGIMPLASRIGAATMRPMHEFTSLAANAREIKFWNSLEERA